MRKLLQMTAVFALALVLTNGAQAKGSKAGASHKSAGTAKTANAGKSAAKAGAGHTAGHAAGHSAGHAVGHVGVRGGIKGAGYRGWSTWNWNLQFGCYFYFSPYDGVYYYWYNPEMTYRPIADIRMFPPTSVTYSTASPGNPPLPQAIASPVPPAPQPIMSQAR
jgi:hypothetical protein